MKAESDGLAGKRGQVGAVVPFDSTLRGVAGERLGGGEHFVVGNEPSTRSSTFLATTFTNRCRPLNFNGRVMSEAKCLSLRLRPKSDPYHPHGRTCKSGPRAPHSRI